MRILHTESSNGWGGQEIRILREAIGMRERGHEVTFAVTPGGKLVGRAMNEGFSVYEVDFSRLRAPIALKQLLNIIKKHRINLVNTHSSLDAWIGGVAARLSRCKVMRTRHLSTPIRAGLNSKVLYGKLADFVVTTSSAIVPIITAQARIPQDRCCCIPTGVEPAGLQVNPKEVEDFRLKLNLKEDDLLIGTACVVRSWKGVVDLIYAADKLRQFKWVVIGGGYLEGPKQLVKELQLQEVVHFTDHLENPYPAIAALDIFALLSRAHEGISQALLQAAYLKKPLIATRVGGSPEVCIDGETGKLISPASPQQLIEIVLSLSSDPLKRQEMGERSRQLIESKFTMKHTLDAIESIYAQMS